EPRPVRLRPWGRMQFEGIYVFLLNTRRALIGFNGVTPLDVFQDLALGSFSNQCFLPAGNLDCPALASERESFQVSLEVGTRVDHQGIKIFFRNTYHRLVGAKDTHGVSALVQSRNYTVAPLRERHFFSIRNLNRVARAC